MQTVLMHKLTQYSRLMRVEKPIGFFLLLWPTLWALWIATEGTPSFKILMVFILGTFLARSAGCVVNDLADRNFDKHVSRTATRPLTAGYVSVTETWVLLSVLGLGALSLTFFLNRASFGMAIMGGLLTCIYPLMKRWVHFPQFFLGLAFSWGIPLAFVATQEKIPLIAWTLYGVSIVWAVIYDTEYAMVDKDDDLKIGVKSTAIWFGFYDRLILFLLQGLMLFSLIGIGVWLKYGVFYFLSCLIVGAGFFYQQWLIRHREKANCFRAFLHNHWIGLIIFLGIFWGRG